MPTVVLSPSRRRQLDVRPPGTLRSSGMSPDDARWAGSTEPEPVSVPRLDGPTAPRALKLVHSTRTAGAAEGVGALIQRGGRAVAGMLTIATAGES